MQPDDAILYAEDSDDDVVLLQRAFIRARIPHPLVTLRDGRAAVDYLKSVATAGAGLRSARPAPALVLLDVRMPYLSGLDVLRWIRSQPPPFTTLPVLMLSSSASDQDIVPAFAAGATGYLVKPGSVEELDALVAGLKQALENLPRADWAHLRGARPPPGGGTEGGNPVPS